MRILILSNIFPPGFIGGYELGALDVARGLRSEGHVVEILTSDYFQGDLPDSGDLNISRSLIFDAFSHNPAGTARVNQLFYNYLNIRKLGAAIRKLNPDTVLAFNLYGLGVLSIVQFLQKIEMPTVLYLMDNIFSGIDLDSDAYKKYASIFGEFELSESTHLIAMSSNVLKEVRELLRLPSVAATFVPGWIVGDEVCLPVADAVSETANFVYCSRVAGHKGIDIVIDATEQLIERGFHRFSVDVYGAGEVTRLLQTVKARNLDAYIQYRGIVSKDKMLQTLSGYDSLVFPTWEREAFGFVASEAAAAGCVPIITAGTGASEWFLDGHDCLKISRDSDSLCGAMEQVMFWSPAKRLAVRRAAMISGKTNFSFNRWLSVIENECSRVRVDCAVAAIPARTHGVEAAFFFLNSLYHESL